MIIVYDITSKDSFDDLEGYIKEGTRYSDRSEKFIVGTCIDDDDAAFELWHSHVRKVISWISQPKVSV